jgi:predicted RNA-binding protein with PIN domain
MVLSAHALQGVKVRLESVSKEVHFTHEAETIYRPYLPQDSSVVYEKYHMVLSAHALQGVQVTLNSVSKEGHFTLEAETVFRPYFPQDSSVVTD